MADYINCYFAFMDLLGFKEMVQNKTCSDILNIFDEAKKHFIVNQITEGNDRVPLIYPEEIHYYIMSDSVCVYIRSDVHFALPFLALLCLNFQVRMLCLDTPVLVRGSISKGNIYENQGILFGPALVEAYLRAEKLARVPRVIIPADLFKEIDDQTEKAMFKGFTYLEADGFYATHYANYFCIHKSTMKYRENVRNHIEGILGNSLDQSVRDKYVYVKSLMDYYREEEDKKYEQ